MDPLNTSEFLWLNGNHSLLVYAHLPGDDYWNWYLLAPQEIPVVTIKAPVESITSLDLHIKKKKIHTLKTKDNCANYALQQDFTQCAKDAIEKEGLQVANCVTFMTRPIISHATLPGNCLCLSTKNGSQLPSIYL